LIEGQHLSAVPHEAPEYTSDYDNCANKKHGSYFVPGLDRGYRQVSLSL